MANGNPGSAVTDPDSTTNSLGAAVGDTTPYEDLEAVGQPRPSGEAPAPRIANDKDFGLIPEGGHYIGPDDVRRVKPYTVDNDATFMKVPEGAHYVGPDGVVRQKPTYGDIGFTAQATHNMALTPQGKLDALRASYGDKVKVDATGPYVVEDDGRVLRPGVRGWKSALGTAASETLPALGMTAGAVAGSAGGTLAGGPVGTAAGGFGGGILGAMGGRQANSVLLSLLGIHEPVGEQVAAMGREGALTALGEPIGRGIGAVVNAVRKAPEAAGQAASAMGGAGRRIAEDLAGVLESFGISPERARSFLGTTEGDILRAKSITDMGGKVPPSVLAPEAPFLKKIEEFDAAFNKDSTGYGRFGQAARDMYEQEGRAIAESPSVGARIDQPLTSAEATVPSKKAGEMAVQEARTRMAVADADLEQRIRLERERVLASYSAAGGPEGLTQAQQGVAAGLRQQYEDNITAANNLIRAGVDDIRLDADRAMRDMATRLGSPDLVQNIANSFRSLNTVIRQRASHYYGLWDQASGGVRVPVDNLQSDAARFFGEIPDALRGKYPVEIRLLERLAAPEGEEAITMTAGELHHLRSWMRHGIDYDDLTPNMREGAMKLFERRVNETIHDVDMTPELRGAVPLLDKADAFYRENIPYLDNEMIRSTMRALKGGTGIDAETAANIFFKSGRSEDVREARRVLGPNLWNAVEAAHIQSLVNKSKSLDGTINAKTFAGYVENDFRKGMLEMGYSAPKAAELVQIAKDIQRLEGDLPINASDTDSLAVLLRKAQAAKLEADAAAKADPVKAFDEAVKGFEKQAEQMRKQAVEDRRRSPIGFLFEEKMPYKANQAADKILSTEDNILAAANLYGRDSTTFNALRQVYVRRFLQREFSSLGGMRAELASPAKGISEEVQQLMFPGVTRRQMLELAHNMEFLFGAASIGGGDIGGSLAGASRVLNPGKHVPGFGKISKIPGVDTGARIVLGKYFATLMEGVSHPEFINWLAKSLNGPPEARLAARGVLSDRLSRSGWAGMAAGQMAAPSGQEPQQQQDIDGQ